MSQNVFSGDNFSEAGRRKSQRFKSGRYSGWEATGIFSFANNLFPELPVWQGEPSCSCCLVSHAWPIFTVFHGPLGKSADWPFGLGPQTYCERFLGYQKSKLVCISSQELLILAFFGTLWGWSGPLDALALDSPFSINSKKSMHLSFLMSFWFCEKISHPKLVKMRWTTGCLKLNSYPIILAVNKWSDRTKSRTVSTFSSVLENECLLLRSLSSINTLVSENALNHQKLGLLSWVQVMKTVFRHSFSSMAQLFWWFKAFSDWK